jgi:hypothetical protein
MQTCIRILKCTFRILKLFFTSLVHCMFRPYMVIIRRLENFCLKLSYFRHWKQFESILSFVRPCCTSVARNGNCVKIDFRTRNTIQKHNKPNLHIDKYEKSNVYQMKCMDCPLKYIGLTGRRFRTRFKEHVQAVRNSNSNSGYSNHILNTRHAYKSITNTVGIIKIRKKGKHLNTLVRCHIYKISKHRLHVNDTYIDAYRPRHSSGG